MWGFLVLQDRLKNGGVAGLSFIFSPLMWGLWGYVGVVFAKCPFPGQPLPARKTSAPAPGRPRPQASNGNPGADDGAATDAGATAAHRRGEAAGPPLGDGHPRPSSPVPWGDAWATSPPTRRRQPRTRADPDPRRATGAPGRRRRGNRCQGNGGAPKRGAAGPPWGDGHPRPSSPVPWGHAWATPPPTRRRRPRPRADPDPRRATGTPGRRHPSPGAMPRQPCPDPKTSAPGPVPARPQASNVHPGPTTTRQPMPGQRRRTKAGSGWASMG